MSTDDAETIAGVSHGYAPDGAGQRDESLPLKAMIRDTAAQIEATFRSEMDLLQARTLVAGIGVKWAAVWALAAVSCMTVALLALAVGLVLFMAQWIGILPGTILVVAGLLALAAWAALLARKHLRDVAAATKGQPPSHSSEPVDT